VEALVNVVVGFIGLVAEEASIVKPRFAFVNAIATGKFLPAELVKEFAVSINFGVDGRE
jgi:hypothetical protein